MLIATDLDGTLALGSKKDILEIYSIFNEYNFKVVYVTGRDIKNFRKLTKTFYKEKGIKLLPPEYLVALNGAKIYKYRKSHFIPIKRLFIDKNWHSYIKPGWNKKACFQAFKTTAEKLRFGDDLPVIVDVRYQPSPYYLESIIHYKYLDVVKDTLVDECKKHNTKVNIIFDYLPKLYVDMGLKILNKIDKHKASIVSKMRDEEDGIFVMQPSATTKGDAVNYLVKNLRLNKSQVYAAGDGGNDYHLLTAGFNSIVVNNANHVLLKSPIESLPHNQKSNIIFVPYDGAKGLLEGLKIALNKPLTHSGNGSLGSIINA